MSRTSCLTKSRNDNILFAMTTDNYLEFAKYITEVNVNNIIDSKNGFTALHYAVKFNNEKMIEYLLNMGANPRLQTNTNKDAFDLSLKYQSKCAIMYELNDKCETSKELQKTISFLEKKIITLNENNIYLMKTANEAVRKNDFLRVQNNEKENENLGLKHKNSELFQENSSLKSNNVSLCDEISTLKKDNSVLKEDNIKTKRKYNSLDQSYIGLLNKIIKQDEKII